VFTSISVLQSIRLSIALFFPIGVQVRAPSSLSFRLLD